VLLRCSGGGPMRAEVVLVVLAFVELDSNTNTLTGLRKCCSSRRLHTIHSQAQAISRRKQLLPIARDSRKEMPLRLDLGGADLFVRARAGCVRRPRNTDGAVADPQRRQVQVAQEAPKTLVGVARLVERDGPDPVVVLVVHVVDFWLFIAHVIVGVDFIRP
jgi:hypothetical protein